LRKTSLKTCFPDYDAKEGDTNEAIAFITKKFLAATSPKRDGPPVLTWPIAARFKKDVQYAFQELREQIMNQVRLGVGVLHTYHTIDIDIFLLYRTNKQLGKHK
jgi:hypothetical protein